MYIKDWQRQQPVPFTIHSNLLTMIKLGHTEVWLSGASG